MRVNSQQAYYYAIPTPPFMEKKRRWEDRTGKGEKGKRKGGGRELEETKEQEWREELLSQSLILAVMLEHCLLICGVWLECQIFLVICHIVRGVLDLVLYNSQWLRMIYHSIWLNSHTQPFYGSVEFVRDNPGEPVPEEIFTHYSLWSSIIPTCFLHLPRSMASSLFTPRALQSFCTISVQVFFGLPFGLIPSTSYSVHFFTQLLSSFRSTCPYHRNLFCCSTEIMSSNSSLPLNSLLGTLSCNFTPHIHLTILISAL